jgi:hypothetical protein
MTQILHEIYLDGTMRDFDEGRCCKAVVRRQEPNVKGLSAALTDDS